MSKYPPSKYQEQIFTWALNARPGENAVVLALAGTGKTTTLEWLYPMLSGSVCFLAFNTSIAGELKNRLPGCNVRTYHSCGLNMITSAYGHVQVDNDRNYKMLKDYLGYDATRILQAPVKKLVSMVKNNLTDDTDTDLLELAQYYGVELNGDANAVFDAVRHLLQMAKHNVKMLDFDDMVWLPNVLGLQGEKFDWVLVDELQDTNKSQSELISRILGPQTRIIGVGDTYQSIYAFRGANSDAMSNFISRWNAVTLPLSITYRNPGKVVNLVHDRFPQIPLEARPNVEDGILENVPYKTAVTKFIDGDMVLCRCNADLVPPCFALIRQGIKAVIRGRDIGSGLVSLIKKMKTDSLSLLLEKLVEYRDIEVQKLLNADKDMAAQAVMDKIETIIALGDGLVYTDDLIARIQEVFSDDKVGVTFSSIHKAKGLEADRVWVLRPDLLPHPMAKKSWEKVQESNLEYVAYTRSKRELYIVTGRM